MPDEFDAQENQDVEFTVNEWQNKPESNILEKARYRFKLVEIVEDNYKVPKSGNICMVVQIVIDGWKKKKCYLVKHDGNGKRTRTSHIYYNFLYSLGVRNTNKVFKFKGSDILNKEGLCDVTINSAGDDNDVWGFSPIEEAIAPLQGVPLETTDTPEPEKPKEEKVKEELKKEIKKEETVEDL